MVPDSDLSEVINYRFHLMALITDVLKITLG